MPRKQVTLTEVLNAREAAMKASLYHTMPGIVTVYHAAVSGKSPPSVDVQPAVHDVRQDTETGAPISEPWPILPEVPIAFPRFGGVSISGPMSPGDMVLLLAFDLDPSAFLTTGQKADPPFTRRHGGTHWIALPCDVTDGKAGADPGPNLVIAQPSGGGLILVGTGATEFAALADKVDANFTTMKTTVSGLVSAVAAMAALFNAPPGPMASATGSVTPASPLGSLPGVAASVTKVK